MNIFVGNLAWGVDDFALREAFEAHGEVERAKVIHDRETGRSRGFGFVEMPNQQEAEAALKTIAKTYVITIGPKGSLVYDGQQLLTVPATEEKPIDTLGAGDMYAGAFLYAITHGMPWRIAGELANLTSSKVVTIHGPRVSPEDTQVLLKNLKKKYLETVVTA